MNQRRPWGTTAEGARRFSVPFSIRFAAPNLGDAFMISDPLLRMTAGSGLHPAWSKARLAQARASICARSDCGRTQAASPCRRCPRPSYLAIEKGQPAPALVAWPRWS